MSEGFDAERAFGGTLRLFGREGCERLCASRVVVVGVGGVGSWAAEALARAGVGHLRLVDLDHIAESNLNRQLPALTSTLGQAKVQALAERLRLVNPNLQVEPVEAFAEPDNLGQLFQDATAVVDAIDAVRVKAAMADFARRKALPLVVCGGAGGKLDATRLRVTDLSEATHDRLLASLRASLRRDFAWPRSGKMKLRVVSSNEAMDQTQSIDDPGARLACAGYGSLVTVTASMGMMAAGELIREIGGR